MGRILFGISNYFKNTFLIIFLNLEAASPKKINLLAQKWNPSLETRDADALGPKIKIGAKLGRNTTLNRPPAPER
jgi:hypothetical protein